MRIPKQIFRHRRIRGVIKHVLKIGWLYAPQRQTSSMKSRYISKNFQVTVLHFKLLRTNRVSAFIRFYINSHTLSIISKQTDTFNNFLKNNKSFINTRVNFLFFIVFIVFLCYHILKNIIYEEHSLGQQRKKETLSSF